MRGKLRTVAAVVAVLAGVLALTVTAGTPSAAAGGGPVLVLGIDAEDGGPGGHGPIAVYEDMLANVFGNVANGGSGVLVIGADPGSSVTSFWDQIATDTGRTVTYADGPAAIIAANFSGVGVIVVSSSYGETFGGLDDFENDGLTTRAADIAAHVNAGGGLIVFTQHGLTDPFAFFGGLGSITSDGIVAGDDEDIDVNAAGTAAGLTDDLDVCCWHEQFLTWPSFLVPLATYAGSTEVAGLGGASVVIGPNPVGGPKEPIIGEVATSSTTSTTLATSTTTTSTPATSTTSTTVVPGSTTTTAAVPTTLTPPRGSFRNCTAARAAGREDIPRSDPAYAPHLDGDGDGIACERVEGASAAPPVTGRPTYTG